MTTLNHNILNKISDEYISMRIKEYNSQIYLCTPYEWDVKYQERNIFDFSCIIKADTERELLFKIFNKYKESFMYKFLTVNKFSLSKYMEVPSRGSLTLHGTIHNSKFKEICDDFDKFMVIEDVRDMIYNFMIEVTGNPRDSQCGLLYVEVSGLTDIV